MIANMNANANAKLPSSSSPPASSDEPPLVLRNMTAVSRQVARQSSQNSQQEAPKTKGWGWGKWLPTIPSQPQTPLQQSEVKQKEQRISATAAPTKARHELDASTSSTASTSQPNSPSSKQPQHPQSPRPLSPSNSKTNKKLSGEGVKKPKAAKKQKKKATKGKPTRSTSKETAVAPETSGETAPSASPQNATSAPSFGTNPLNNLFRRGGLLGLKTPARDAATAEAGRDDQAQRELALKEKERRRATHVQTETAWYERDLRRKQRSGDYLSDDDHYALGLYDRQRYGEDLAEEELSELLVLADAQRQTHKDEAELEVLLEQQEAGVTIDSGRLYQLQLSLKRRMGQALTEEEDDVLYSLEQRRRDQIDLALLLSQREEGTEVDEGRLYELELLDRRHSGDSDNMTEEELRDVQLLERRREDARLDEKDFEQLLRLQQRKKTGEGGDQEIIDEDRYHILSLVDRRRRGESLTEDEDQDLDEYYDLRDEEHLDSIELSMLLDKRDKGEPNIDEERIYQLELFERTREGKDLTDEEERDFMVFQKRRDQERAETKERNGLLERNENGDDVDRRLYEFELLKRKQHNDDLTDDEEGYLANLAERRKQQENEAEELCTLLARKDRGEAIDQQRLYFLELVDRKSRGEDLTHEETEDFSLMEEQEMAAKQIDEELNDLLNRKANGEDVDENCLYVLELFRRKRLGEDLTDDEIMDLELWELQRTEGQDTLQSLKEVDEKEEESITSYDNMGLTSSERDALDKVQIELKAQGLPISIEFSPGSKQRDKLQMSCISHSDESYIQDLVNQRENRADERQEETLEEALELYHIALMEKKLPESEQLFLDIFDKILKEKNDEARENDRKFDNLVEFELKQRELRKQEQAEKDKYTQPPEEFCGQQAVEIYDVCIVEAECHRGRESQSLGESNFSENDDGKRLKGQGDDEVTAYGKDPDRLLPQAVFRFGEGSSPEKKIRGVEQSTRAGDEARLQAEHLIHAEEESQSKAEKASLINAKADVSSEAKNSIEEDCDSTEERRQLCSKLETLEEERIRNTRDEHEAHVKERLLHAEENDVVGGEQRRHGEDQTVLHAEYEELRAEESNHLEAEPVQSREEADADVKKAEAEAKAPLQSDEIKRFDPVGDDPHFEGDLTQMLREEAHLNIAEIRADEKDEVSTGAAPSRDPTQIFANAVVGIRTKLGSLQGGKLVEYEVECEMTDSVEPALLQNQTVKINSLQTADLNMQLNANAKLEEDPRRQPFQASLLNSQADERMRGPFQLDDDLDAETFIQDGKDRLQNDGTISSDDLTRRMKAPDEKTGQELDDPNDFALTDGEYDELNTLLDAQERGEVVDYDRLNELELLDRYGLGEQLTFDEAKNLDVIMKRRKRFQMYTAEYNVLLDRQESGEDVDEGRLYSLELIVRKRLGESLTEAEMDDLFEFEAAEEGKEGTEISELSGYFGSDGSPQVIEHLEEDLLLIGISDEPLALLPEVEEEELSQSECSDRQTVPIATDGYESQSQDEALFEFDINEELNRLLELREQGEEIDEQRLYELELLFRHANGEDLSNEEMEDLDFFMERKLRLEFYTKEYNELLDRKEMGHPIDEDRLYHLELVVRNHLGESLTDEEFDVLEMFESQEEKVAAFKCAEDQETYAKVSMLSSPANQESALADKGDTGNGQDTFIAVLEDQADGMLGSAVATGDISESAEEIAYGAQRCLESFSTKIEPLDAPELSARDNCSINELTPSPGPHQVAMQEYVDDVHVDRRDEHMTSKGVTLAAFEETSLFEERSKLTASASKGTNANGIRHETLAATCTNEKDKLEVPKSVHCEGMKVCNDGLESSSFAYKHIGDDLMEDENNVGVTCKIDESDMAKIPNIVGNGQRKALPDGSETFGSTVESSAVAQDEGGSHLFYNSIETSSLGKFQNGIEQNPKPCEGIRENLAHGFLVVDHEDSTTGTEVKSEEEDFVFDCNDNASTFSVPDWNGSDEKKDSFSPKSIEGDEGYQLNEEDRYLMTEDGPRGRIESTEFSSTAAVGSGESVEHNSESDCDVPPLGMKVEEDREHVAKEGCSASRSHDFLGKNECFSSSDTCADVAQSTSQVNLSGEIVSDSTDCEDDTSNDTHKITGAQVEMHASEDVTLQTDETSESDLHPCEQASNDLEQKEQSDGLTTSELEELIDLIDKNENGDDIDEERLYELELLDRHSRSEVLTIEEIEDLEFIKERRRLLVQYKIEYDAMVAKKRDGEDVDEIRLYSIGLVEKRRVGDPLTNEELMDLEDFEMEEAEKQSETASSEAVHNIKFFDESCSQSQPMIDFVGEARNRAREILASDGFDDAADVDGKQLSSSPLSLRDSAELVRCIADPKNEAIDQDKDELNDLFDRCDKGEQIDEERVKELDLLERHRLGEQLFGQEQQDVLIFRDQREHDNAWESEYEHLLDLQRMGENVDQERFYFLELLDRNRQNEKLSEIECHDLQVLLSQENQSNSTAGHRAYLIESLEVDDARDMRRLKKEDVVIEVTSNEFLSQAKTAQYILNHSTDFPPVNGNESDRFCQPSPANTVETRGKEGASTAEEGQMSLEAAREINRETIDPSTEGQMMNLATHLENRKTEQSNPLDQKSLSKSINQEEDASPEDNDANPNRGWGARLFGFIAKKQETVDRPSEFYSTRIEGTEGSPSKVTHENFIATDTTEFVPAGSIPTDADPLDSPGTSVSHHTGQSIPRDTGTSGVQKDSRVTTIDSERSDLLFSKTTGAPSQGSHELGLGTKRSHVAQEKIKGEAQSDPTNGGTDAFDDSSHDTETSTSLDHISLEFGEKDKNFRSPDNQSGNPNVASDKTNDLAVNGEGHQTMVTAGQDQAFRVASTAYTIHGKGGVKVEDDIGKTVDPSSDHARTTPAAVATPVDETAGNDKQIFEATEPALRISDEIEGDCVEYKAYEDELFKKERNGEELNDDELFELEMFLKRRRGIILSDDELDELEFLREKNVAADLDDKELEELRNKLSLGEVVDEERFYELDLLARYRNGENFTYDEMFELDAFDRIRLGEELSPEEIEDLGILREERNRAKKNRVDDLQQNDENGEIDKYQSLEILLRRKQGLTDYEVYGLELLDQLRAGDELNETERNDIDHMRTLYVEGSSPEPDRSTHKHEVVSLNGEVDYVKEPIHRSHGSDELQGEELYELGLLSRLVKGETLCDDELNELRRLRQERENRSQGFSKLEYLRSMGHNRSNHDDDLFYEIELLDKSARHEALDEDEQTELELFEKRRTGEELSSDELNDLQRLKKERVERGLDEEDLRDLRERKGNGEDVDEDLLYELELFDFMRKGVQLSDNQVFELKMFQQIREGEVLTDEEVADLEHLKRERLEVELDEEDLRDLLEKKLRGESIDEDLLYELRLFQRNRNGDALSDEELFELDLFERRRDGEELAEDDLDELELLKSNRLRQVQSSIDQDQKGQEAEEDNDEDSVYRRDLLERQMKGQRLDKQEFHWLEILQKQKRTEELLEDELDELEIMRHQRKEKHVVVQNTKQLLEKEMNRKMRRELKERNRKEKLERKEQRKREKSERPKVKKMRRKIKKKDSVLSTDVMSEDNEAPTTAPLFEVPAGSGAEEATQVEIIGLPPTLSATEKKETSKNGIFGGVFGRNKKSKKEMELEEMRRRQEELIKEQMKAMSLEHELKELEKERQLQEQLVQETIDKKGAAEKDSVSSWETDTAHESIESEDDDSSSMSSSSSSDSDSSENTFEAFEVNKIEREGCDLKDTAITEGLDCTGSSFMPGESYKDESLSPSTTIKDVDVSLASHPSKCQSVVMASADCKRRSDETPRGDPLRVEVSPVQSQALKRHVHSQALQSKSADVDELSVNSGTYGGGTKNAATASTDESLGKHKTGTTTMHSPKCTTNMLTLAVHLKKQLKKKRTSKKNKTKYGDDLSIGSMQWSKLQKESRVEEDAESRRVNLNVGVAGPHRREERPWMASDGDHGIDLRRFSAGNSALQVRQPVAGEADKFFGKENQHVFDRSIFNFHQSFTSKISLGNEDDASKGSESEADSLTSAEVKRECDADTKDGDQTDDLDAHQSLLESLASSTGTLQEEAYLFTGPDYDNIESRLAEKFRSKEAEFDAAWENIVADQNVAAQINQRLRERQRVKGSGRDEKAEDGNDIHNLPRLFLFEGEKSTRKKKKKKSAKKKDRKLQSKLDRTFSKEFRKAMKEVFNSESEDEYDKTFGGEGARDGDEMQHDAGQNRRGNLIRVNSNEKSSEDESGKSNNDGAGGSVASDESDGFDGAYLQRLQERSMQQEVKQMMYESRRQLLTENSGHSESSDDEEMSQASGNSRNHHQPWQGTNSSRHIKDRRHRRKGRKPKRNRTGELVGDDVDPADVYTKEVEKQKEKKAFTIADLRKEMEDLKQTNSFVGSAGFHQPSKPALALRKPRPPKAPKKPASNVSLDGPDGLQPQRPGLGARATSFATTTSDQGLLTGAPKSFGGGLGAHPETIEEEDEEEEETFLTGGNQTGDFGGFNDSPGGNSKNSSMGFNNRFSTFSFFGASSGDNSKTPSKSRRLPSFSGAFGSNIGSGFLSPVKNSRSGGGLGGGGGGLGHTSLSMAAPPPLVPHGGFGEPLPLPEMQDDDRSKSRRGSLVKLMGKGKTFFSNVKIPGKRRSSSDLGGGFMMDDDDDRDEGGMGLLG